MGYAAKLGAVALAVGLALGAASATAATINFSGPHASPYVESDFAFSPARIVNGNCLSAGGCLALNDNETSTLSRSAPPPAFTLTGFSFNLLGNGTGNSLSVTGSNGTSRTYDLGSYTKNAYHTLAFADEFANVTSVVFSTMGGGNVRVDDVSVAPVPLPAAAWLLLGALGGLGALRARKHAIA